MNKKLIKPLATFIEEELPGCDFVGISDEKEVFISFNQETPEGWENYSSLIKEKFGDEIKEVTPIIKTDINVLKQLVDDLNTALEKELAPNTSNLLQIK